MDNITHALIGLAAGEAICKVQNKISVFWSARKNKEDPKPASPSFMPEEIPPGRGAILLTSVVANNLPDLDSLFLNRSEPLSYLMYHRGYSHTLLGAIPQAVLITLCYFLFRYFQIRRERMVFPPEQVSFLGIFSDAKRKQVLLGGAWILLTALVGITLHIFADYWNSYGIHPFWPLRDRWYYGDFLFILEPWLWLTLCLGLMWGTRDRRYRFLGIIALPVIIFLCWRSKAVPWGIMMALVIWHLLYTLAFRRIPEGKAFFYSCLSVITVLFVFLGASRYARSQIREAAWLKNPEAKLQDLILSPLPANPICWSFVTVQTEGVPPAYKLQAGIFSLFAKKMGPDFCLRYQSKLRDIGSDLVKATSDERVVFTDFFKMPLSDLQKLLSNCRVAAFMKFARAPYVKTKKDQISVGDYRFGRIRSHGFTDFYFSKTDPTCPDHVAPWKEPRADVFRL